MEDRFEQYSLEAKNAWGKTDAYKEYEHRSKGRTKEEEQSYGLQLMDIFREFGLLRDSDPEEAGYLVVKLQNFITEHFYTCTDQILASLGDMYSSGGEMTENIDNHAGEGTAMFADKAIKAYLRNQNN